MANGSILGFITLKGHSGHRIFTVKEWTCERNTPVVEDKN